MKLKKRSAYYAPSSRADGDHWLEKAFYLDKDGKLELINYGVGFSDSM
jgi:hypothetical protein